MLLRRVIAFIEGVAVTVTAKVFMSGHSQALRLPVKLRLATICGGGCTIFCATSEPLPEDFLADRQDTPAQERDWT